MDYSFTEFKELAHGDGFHYPVDVRYNTIYLGSLIVNPNGYVIRMVDTPSKHEFILPSKNNLFRTKQDAAVALHKVWKKYRHGGDELVPA